MENIGILARCRIPDVKSDGGFDTTLCLAGRSAGDHPLEAQPTALRACLLLFVDAVGTKQIIAWWLTSR